MNGDSAEQRLVEGLDSPTTVDQSEAHSVDESEGTPNDLPPRPKTPEDSSEDMPTDSEGYEIGKITEALKQLGKQNEYLKNGFDEMNMKTNNVSDLSFPVV